MKSIAFLCFTTFIPLIGGCRSESGSIAVGTATPDAIRSCKQKIQQEMLARQAFSFRTDLPLAIDSTVTDAAVKTAQMTRMVYERSSQNQTKGLYSDISLTRRYTTGDDVIDMTQELALGGESEEATDMYLSLEVSGTHYKAGTFVQDFSEIMRYKLPACIPSLASLSRTTAAPLAGTTITLTSESYDLISRIQGRQTISVPPAAFANNIRFASPEDVPIGVSGDFVFSSDGLYSLNVAPAPGMEHLDPIVGQVVPFTARLVTYTKNGAVLFSQTAAFSTASPYVLTSIIDFGENKSEIVNENLWLTSDLGTSSADEPQFRGFTANDSYEPKLSYQVDAKGPLNFDNYEAYFKFEEIERARDGWHSYRVEADLGGPDWTALAKPMPDYSGTSLEKYLNDSYYITLSDPGVQALVAKIKSHLPADASQGAMITAIMAEVTTAIKYDYEALTNDNVRLIRASDALARGKGVCQHFAAVFVTLARALGLPSRVIAGYHFSSDKAANVIKGGGHAWVEVAVNGKWLPIEPQSTFPSLGALTYFPIYVMNSYERAVGAQEDIASKVAYAKLMAGLEFIKIGMTPPSGAGN